MKISFSQKDHWYVFVFLIAIYGFFVGVLDKDFARGFGYALGGAIIPFVVLLKTKSKNIPKMYVLVAILFVIGLNGVFADNQTGAKRIFNDSCVKNQLSANNERLDRVNSYCKCISDKFTMRLSLIEDGDFIKGQLFNHSVNELAAMHPDMVRDLNLTAATCGKQVYSDNPS